jgi:Zn-dependent alcohol dehydrogenase
MTVYGTLTTSQPSGPGWWAECTLATAIPVTGTSTAAASIVYNNVALREFQPSLPMAVCVLVPTTATSAAGTAYTTLQNGTNNILSAQSTVTGGIGIASAILGVTAVQTNTSTSLVSYTETGTLTITFVNAGATSTLTAGTRLLIGQFQGN